MEAAPTTLGEVRQEELGGHFALRAWAERVLFAFLVVLFLYRAFMPAWSRIGSDFANYYLAASVYREGYPVDRVYEWTWFQRQKDHLAIDRPLVGFAPSTMTSSLLVLPLASMPPLKGNRWWLVVSLACLGLSVVILKQVTSLPWRQVGVLTFLAVAPLHNNFLLGQVHVTMLLLLAVAAWLYFDDHLFLCGIVLAAAAALKIYPALFLLFFIVKRQWRGVAGLLSGSLGAILVSAGVFGTTACLTYFREILPWGLRGEIIDPYALGWDSLNTLLHRLFVFEPELNPAPVAHLPYLYSFLHALVYSLTLVAFLRVIVSSDVSRPRKKLEWASYCFLLLLLSSEPLPYHFVILILTAVLVVDYLIARGRLGWASAIVVVYALICVPYNRVYNANPTGWMNLFFFPRFFWMLVFAGMLLWLLFPDSSHTSRQGLRSRWFAQGAVAFGVLFVVGFLLDARHMARQFDNYQTRVTTVIGSAIAVDPVVTDAEIFYGGLVPRFEAKADAYSEYRFRDGSVTPYGGGGDWFHPAATTDGRETWAEVASVGNSRIVRFDATRNASGDASVVTEIDNAEQPVVSADARWLAYIREVGGRGSLWIRPIGGPQVSQSQPGADSEREIAGPQFDVREAALSTYSQVAFSSWQGSEYRLFTIDLPSGRITPFTSTGCSARYPAFSPDGRWIAFSCEKSGVWQLTAMNFVTGEKRQLTTADCNSVTPAWTRDSRSLIYATDCGRGLGMTALSKIEVVR